MSQRIDMIVFGATGFTGKHTAEEIHRVIKSGQGLSELTWGVAGRSQSKLEKVIKDLQEKTGDDLSKVKIFIADVKDPESLKAMSSQAKVVVNCCGPYRFFGEPVVKACIETATHHVDVSGEPAYMELIQLQYNEAAQKAGVYIISACGYDSIPADLGVIYLAQNFKGQLNSAESYMSFKMEGYTPNVGEAMVNYGTWESLIHGLTQSSELGPLRRQLYQTKLPDLSPRLQARGTVHKSSVDNLWHIPFPGADKSVVYRSQRFLYETEKKRPVQMNPYFGFPGILSLMCIFFMGAVLKIMTLCDCGKNLLLKHPRFFSMGMFSHEGPSEACMKACKFFFNIVGNGWDQSVTDIENVKPNKSMQVRVTGCNPAYGATCTSLVFSAITILKEVGKMPGSGGVLSPGAAFAQTSLIENLNKNNLKFEVVTDNKSD